MLLRHVQNRSATLRKTLYVGSTATNPTPDSATITVTRDDGTPVVTNAPTTDEGTGVFSYTLTPAQMATLDRLDVVWTASFGGFAQQFRDTVEVVGETFFTIAEAREVPPLNNVTAHPDDKILRVRTRIEQRMEKLLGYACVPRYEREVKSSYGSGPIRLSWPLTRAVREVSVAGTLYSPSELALVSADHGFLYSGTTSGSWTAGWSNVIVAYEHGRDYIDEDIKSAALILAKIWLTSGPVDDRTATFSSMDGGTFSLVTPGRGGSTVGVPEVDAVIEQNRLVFVA